MQNVSERIETAGPVRVAICIATFRRLQPLQTLLGALARLRFDKMPEPSLQIIVVDNDANQSARPVCQRSDFPWPLRYICEPRRGISRARNRAIECTIDTELLVFTDDDDVPDQYWLDELLWTQSRFQADVVSGNIFPVFAKSVSEWIRSGNFFQRPIFATGTPVQLCSTGNVLIHSKVFAAVSRFDEQFNLSGCEDTHFFIRARQAGFRMVFSKEAIVHEPISAQRANVSWLLRRGFQAGNGWAHCERNLHPGWRVALLRVLKELVHIGQGVFHLLAAPFLGKAQLVRSLQTISTGLGTLAGAAGYRFLPYKNVGDTNLSRTPMKQTTGKIKTETLS